MKNKICRIIIAEDHDVFREGLKVFIETIENAKVVAEASNGQELLDVLETHKCDIVFTDIKMPVMDGIQATKLAMQKYPNLKIAALSMYGDEKYLQSMLEAGAKGFILKKVKRNELELAIQSLSEGNNYFSQELLSFFTDKFLGKNTNIQSKFTERELEVLQLLAKGYSNQQISDTLFISAHTVIGHRANLISKTGSKNIVDLLLYSIINKLVEI